ncbi:mediator of RNA polymerase II transcription subunit [Trema orientale]|uniref:Mediator of RNA polymerase II transcription subunit n=1 Tax=Trema orientale TaxID=63057 RepID=A0A2P5FK83_TREOI|nr:mediator of RNA polymerase II transcription subunit [Trema orientale]
MSITMTTSSFYSLSLPPRPHPGCSARLRPGIGTWQTRVVPPRVKVIACALHRDAFDHGYDGKLVDEDMIVLRKRIHEIKTAEGSHEDDVASSDWMEWEKEYYANNYDSDICEGLGMLQSQLMNTRPSLALAMLGVVSLSVPISMAVVLLRLMDLAKDVLVGLH